MFHVLWLIDHQKNTNQEQMLLRRMETHPKKGIASNPGLPWVENITKFWQNLELSDVSVWHVMQLWHPILEAESC